MSSGHAATQPPVSNTHQAKSRLERETVIIFNEAESEAKLWTASLREANKWLRLGLQVTADNGGWRATITKSAVRLRNPSIRRALSPEHKAALVRGRQAKRPAAHASNEDNSATAV